MTSVLDPTVPSSTGSASTGAASTGAARAGQRHDAGPLLVGDIGGTHLRLALVAPGTTAPEHVRVLAVADHRDLTSAVTAYLADLRATGTDVPAPSAGCVAVAAPVDGDAVALTNSDLSFSVAATADELGLQRGLLVVNDVEALARSVTELGEPGEAPDAPVSLAGSGLRTDRTVVVVAPGTGLGVAALVPTVHGPVVVAGEGGQVPLPVAGHDALDITRDLLLRRDHVSAEDLVCGLGLPRLDLALRRRAGEEEPWPRTSEEIGGSGETGPGQVLRVFSDLLAAVAQSHALTFGARGGVVLGGGFLASLVPALRCAGFVQRFTHHPKMAALLADVPVLVDTRRQPALVGAALLHADRTRADSSRADSSRADRSRADQAHA